MKQQNNPLGPANGSMLPANFGLRLLHKWRAEKDLKLLFLMNVEHGGWNLNTDTDRIMPRFILAQRCGLWVEIDKTTGRAKKAEWILTTGEECFGEYPIEQVEFEAVEVQRLKSSTDLNLSSSTRVGVAGATSLSAWYALAEHLPAVGEAALIVGVSGAILLENRTRVGLKWGTSNYAVGSILQHGLSVIDCIKNDLPIFDVDGEGDCEGEGGSESTTQA